MYASICERKRTRTKLLGLLKVQKESIFACSAHGREHGKDLGLPRTLGDVLDAVQHQVFQLEMPIADTPALVANIILLVKLSSR